MGNTKKLVVDRVAIVWVNKLKGSSIIQYNLNRDFIVSYGYYNITKLMTAFMELITTNFRTFLDKF
jgi:hypothetical protein